MVVKTEDYRCKRRLSTTAPWNRLLFGIAALVLGLTLNACAEFPEQPIDVLVPFGAGGGSDVFVPILPNAIRE